MLATRTQKNLTKQAKAVSVLRNSMKIYKLDATGDMSITGSGVLRSIQNNTDHLLDLFVRESIQNSLDARDESSEEFVKVEYLLGEFDKRKLNVHLAEIENNLNQMTDLQEKCDFIAIKDSNTTGLTGPLKVADIRDNNWGNLRKLVYYLQRPQTESGAGGSWGIGKSLYYRLSQVGLVIYYSRIKNVNGNYESRLCAALCEDEKNSKTILPPDDNNNKSGIAWWGEIDEDNRPYPITDEEHMNKILHVFGITPFEHKQVGTVVIIPYINRNELALRQSGNYETLEDTIKLLVQRWYFPRLDNPLYKEYYGKNDNKTKYLKVFINGEEIKSNDIFPIFKCMQYMYNSALKGMSNDEIDWENTSVWEIKNEQIKYFDNRVGIMSYLDIDVDSVFFNGFQSPIMYFKNEDTNEQEKNEAIFFVTRKPGMIVNYKKIDKISSTKDKLILAMFVLDSKAKDWFPRTVSKEDRKRINNCKSEQQNTKEPYTLEDYVRESERSDHKGWEDHDIYNAKYRIKCIKEIENKCNSILQEVYTNQDSKQNNDSRTLSGLSNLLGDALQIKPNKKGAASGHGTKKVLKESNGIKYTLSNIKYQKNEMLLKIHANSKKQEIKEAYFQIGANVDSLFYDFNKWEKEIGKEPPFSISDYTIHFIDPETGDEVEKNVLFSHKYVKTETYKKNCGVYIATKDKAKHVLNIVLYITISLNRRDIQPEIKF